MKNRDGEEGEVEVDFLIMIIEELNLVKRL